jgi:iron complex transport system substrate-binding protein
VDRLSRIVAACGGACLLALAAPPAAPAAASRIVSLAPHVTELVYAAGAGESLVGASEFSDYPAEALSLPRVGDAFRLDYERIVSLRPDFAVAWESGTPAASIARLEALGVRVVVLRVKVLDDISAALVELGGLAGTSQVAEAAAGGLRQGFAELRRQYANRPVVRVFVQLDDAPLFTVTGRHLISEMVALCGGRNVFAELPGLAPSVDLEAVIGADPELILYMGGNPEPPRHWRNWQGLAATRLDSVIRIPPDLVARATPRALDGAREVCSAIERTRELRRRQPPGMPVAVGPSHSKSP